MKIYIIPSNLRMISTAKNHMMKAKAILMNDGLAFTVTREPTADPMAAATAVTPSSRYSTWPMAKCPIVPTIELTVTMKALAPAAIRAEYFM